MSTVLSILFWPFAFFWRLSKVKKIIVLVVVIAIGFGIYRYAGGQNNTDGIMTEAAKMDSVTQIVSESGIIASRGRTDVYSPATGIVTEVLVANGDQVEEGQELFVVRSTATEQEKQAAHANYLTALASLNAANSTSHTLRSTMYTEWEQFRNLATNDTYETSEGEAKVDDRLATEFQTSQDDWIAAEKKYKDQGTAIAAANASVASTWQLYQATQDATVTAQSSGTIANLSVAEGDKVSVFQSAVTTPGVGPVVTIADFSTMTVIIELGQTKIAQVVPGQMATFYPDAYADQSYEGYVVRVDHIGDDSQGVVQYTVYLAITDADDLLRSGMTLDADIVTNELTSVLSVPNGAVKPYEGGRAVRIVGEDGEPEFIPVKIGVKGKERTQILSGIELGQEVIVSLSNDQVKRGGGLFGG